MVSKHRTCCFTVTGIFAMVTHSTTRKHAARISSPPFHYNEYSNDHEMNYSDNQYEEVNLSVHSSTYKQIKVQNYQQHQ